MTSKIHARKVFANAVGIIVVRKQQGLIMREKGVTDSVTATYYPELQPTWGNGALNQNFTTVSFCLQSSHILVVVPLLGYELGI
jgi:hypothetical protein